MSSVKLEMCMHCMPDEKLQNCWTTRLFCSPDSPAVPRPLWVECHCNPTQAFSNIVNKHDAMRSRSTLSFSRVHTLCQVLSPNCSFSVATEPASDLFLSGHLLLSTMSFASNLESPHPVSPSFCRYNPMFHSGQSQFLSIQSNVPLRSVPVSVDTIQCSTPVSPSFCRYNPMFHSGQSQFLSIQSNVPLPPDKIDIIVHSPEWCQLLGRSECQRPKEQFPFDRFGRSSLILSLELSTLLWWVGLALSACSVQVSRAASLGPKPMSCWH